MRVKDIIKVEDLKNAKLFNDNKVIEDNKPNKIRNGLKKVGKIALNSLGTIGDLASVAGMLLPAVGLAGAAVSGVSKILGGVSAIGDIAGAVSSAGELFNEKSQLAGMEA